MSAKEVEAQKVRAWKARAKGHPTKWRTYRDCVAVLSLGWMSTFQVQIAMRRLWALKNRTTRDILEELEEEKAVSQEKDDKYPEKGYLWGATEEGVNFWIRNVQAIPAGIVEAAATAMSVTGFETEGRLRT